MTCFACKGNVEKSTTTYMTECDGSYIIIKNTMRGRIFKWRHFAENRINSRKAKKHAYRDCCY